jgi:DnaK suppressor protein
VDQDLPVGGPGVTGGADRYDTDTAIAAGNTTVTDDADATNTDASGDLDIALLDAIEQELADVERALDRLGDGTYGRCETCGQVLSDGELQAAPAGRFCPAHLPLTLP